MRGARIEIIGYVEQNMDFTVSLPVRGARIEIFLSDMIVSTRKVAPCEGSVD